MEKVELKFICENENITLGEELKKHLSKRYYKSLRMVQPLVFVNGKPSKSFEKINKGDCILIRFEKEIKMEWPLYESKLDICFEDEYYLIVNKRAGLLSIPTKGEPYSLYQEVLYYLSHTHQSLHASILNRLDRDTKGLVVIAKSRLAANYLQPTHRKMIRKYRCLCEGIVEKDEGDIINSIASEEGSHKRYISEEKGKLAISHYKVLKRNENSTLMEFILETGRTHQIRLHTKCLGHPIVGDIIYGDAETSDLHLCSCYIEFVHPFTKKKIKYEIESGWE